MGNAGAVSVERYPLPNAEATSGSERSRLQGRLLSRARQNLRDADSRTLAGIALLSLAAAVLMFVIALRRVR